MEHEGVLATSRQAIPFQARKDLRPADLKRMKWFPHQFLEYFIDGSDGPKTGNPLRPGAAFSRNCLTLLINQVTNLGRKWFGEMAIRIINQVAEAPLQRCKL